ncbi:cyclic pyranopterin monophosphate synthase MoaC [Aquifex aeolicus]|uniref:Cyclic pyranopterin monophosphate synthase n=1 Tax=Aquifex aeolicus (strain VF5) TaxID=224324 RepID=MOAC_AQUAE|nr:cyclic pyranopterin monophosphate synthase MoaC [Aquifex aeolicus]O66810.1 RecName: Full=Cyclic pyranopterin monophosphate synthase; AltName: Full=Molybdenum cofactor biosynthesis protein C [Aquifex aeolicus VF5]AAC06772.1 molybdenum cofactor biosynthesis moaC [Aquifex aeolicus VF5]
MRTVDITTKIETLREAKAYGRIRLKPETVKLIKENKVPKGNLVEATKLSGIFGAKKTGELLPFCHPIPLDFVALEVKVNEDNLEVFSTVRGIARTGYEMEALTAVTTALLNVYDMCKALDDSMVIEEVKLLEKSGGKSDWFRRLDGVKVNLHAENEGLRKIAEDYLKELGATFAEEAELYISIGDNLPINKEIRSLERVISLYDFRRNPKEVGKEIRVGWSDDALIIILPESEEKIRFFFETFGGIIGNLLCRR